MKKLTLLLPIFLLSSFTSQADSLAEPAISAAQVSEVQKDTTYTYVRCWYRTGKSHDEVESDWQWARNSNGGYLKITGYWWSSISYKNMFYTNTTDKTIRERCNATLDLDNENSDITYYAADNRFSYNQTIWTNDSAKQPTEINKVVVFGDSLSDTGNMFNAAMWRFPSPGGWFVGHFSNGLVWTEYLAKAKNLPIYNWAVGGAAGSNQYIALTGIYDQVSSYLTYMKIAKNYQPANTLFTLEFGLNDFINYDRSVADVKADFSRALIRLTSAGATNIVLMTLPDGTQAPQFKYSSVSKAAKIRAKILEFNVFIKEQASYYIDKGYKITLYDTFELFEQLTSNPQQHGFVNAKDACLDINRSSAVDYLYSHDLRAECARVGSDKFVFWGVTHPTTAAHKYIAEKILATGLVQHTF